MKKILVSAGVAIMLTVSAALLALFLFLPRYPKNSDIFPEGAPLGQEGVFDSPFTEEEFWTYVREHGVDLTQKDFDNAGESVENFCRENCLNAKRLELCNLDLKECFDEYTAPVRILDDEPYLTYGLEPVESTNQEFYEFLVQYFRSLGYPVNRIWDNRKAIVYRTDLPGDSPSVSFHIYRTEDLKPEDLESLEPCTVFSGPCWFSVGRSVPLYKSRNGKYMMWIDSSICFFLEERYRMIENFCTIED